MAVRFGISYNIIGEGFPIIFVHGIGSRKYTWSNVIKKLKNQYQCISYDLRGHGDSNPDNSNFTLLDLVADLESLRSHLNMKKIHIVGHSLGGMIGPAYARKFPDKVYSVSLLSTAAFRTKEDQKKVLQIIENIKDKGIKNILPNLISRWFTDEFIINNPHIIDKRMKQVYETDIKTFLNVFKIYALTEMSPWLNELKMPCLVLTGENDIGCNQDMNKKIAKAIPNAKLEILKKLKHTITIEAGDIVGDKINRFLSN
tara:strand:- start:1753 stop:2523 length:771 start_codon:yes stop_codon:yes gene_type:complete